MDKTLSLKEQLYNEIEQIPEPLLSQLLDFALFIRNRHTEDNLFEEEKISITAYRSAFDAGDYLTLEEYEAALSFFN